MKASMIVGVVGAALGASAQLVHTKHDVLERVKGHLFGLCVSTSPTAQSFAEEQKCLCTDLSKDNAGFNWFAISSAFARAQNPNNECWDNYFRDFGKEYCSAAIPQHSYLQMDQQRRKC